MKMPFEQKREQFQRFSRSRTRPANRYAGRHLPVPQVYLPPGTIHARIYLDAEGDFIRSLDVHKVNQLEVLCGRPQVCHICESLEEIPSWREKRWKYGPREICFCYASIDRYDRRRRQVPLRQPVLLWGYKRFGDKLCEIIAGLSPEGLSTFFTPEKLFPLLKIESDEKGVNINMAWRERLRAQAPVLPKNLPPLSQCVYPVNDRPNQELQARFIKNMKRAYEKDAAMKTNGHGDPKASANSSTPTDGSA